MKVVSTLEELRSAKSDLPSPLGLVPTMGFLHEGHLSLVKRAKGECESVGVSIFVNPTQFGEGEDLEAYPRDLPRDLRLLEEDGVDLVWVPTVEDVYPTDSQTWVVVEEITKQLEGGQRPGHFRGVTTAVAKLFNAFQPDRAYFGQKDAQQALVIQRMVKDLLLPIEIVVCPIVREKDGLAMSSRNAYLSPEQRRAAIVLHHALGEAAERFHNGERDAEVLRGSMLAVIQDEPLARAQYVSVADPDTLEEAQGEIQRALLSMAVYVGETRLIDNVMLGLD
ncbi:MAG: pantoate--beta-alanine ligase [Anaerolineales bacterium]|nr:MAG: pantoate--beta-alanine ligase [Anaerolineales bacterium]